MKIYSYVVTWRSNSYGLDLNREHFLMELTYENDTFLSDNKRYNNISYNTPGPLGYGSNKVESNENSFLFDLICKLYNEGKYDGLISYHGTGVSFTMNLIKVVKNMMSF